jgi:hypothetical protein
MLKKRGIILPGFEEYETRYAFVSPFQRIPYQVRVK